ncbi:MAG: hypothetical protein KAJ11_06030 [Alphaproteobacteria bacterium]|nr:hypothetical protein [Alphaproteobacteria bacterium]
MTVPATKRAPLLFAIAVVGAIGAVLVLALLRDLPSRVENGKRAHLAIQTLDEVRRPFLEIQDAVTVLMNEGDNESVRADFQRAVARGQGLIADYRAAAAYNPEVLRHVDRLAVAFEAWVEDEQAVFELAERSGPGVADVPHASRDALHALEAIAAKGFSLTMSLLGDAEGPIHDDIDRGSEAVAELTVIGGALIAVLAGAAFLLLWSRNRTLRTMLAERKQAAEEIHRLNEDLEQRVEERTAALRNAQAELVRSERLATLGQLTGTVAHELRNPLGAIMNSLGVIRLKCQKAGVSLDMDKSLDRADRGIKRCDGIITELLDFARSRGLQPEPTALDAWLGELLDEQQLPEGITVVRDCGLDDTVVSIDRDEVRRAVINVIDNACQAITNADGDNGIAGCGVLTVATRGNGERIEIEIADTGPGIPEDVLPNIFEPLFSTKSFGVGLGLSIVRQVMEHHGGGLEIASKQGQGTQAVLWLPISRVQQSG